MKTAISLPDELFASADALARKLGIPRSRLVAEALAEYVAKHRSAGTTARINAVYEKEQSRVETDVRGAQRRTLGRSDW
jgi:metal-responsive CopG/Arc/MetJ family transcriptional regulator